MLSQCIYVFYVCYWFLMVANGCPHVILSWLHLKKQIRSSFSTLSVLGGVFFSMIHWQIISPGLLRMSDAVILSFCFLPWYIFSLPLSVDCQGSFAAYLTLCPVSCHLLFMKSIICEIMQAIICEVVSWYLILCKPTDLLRTLCLPTSGIQISNWLFVKKRPRNLFIAF